MPIEVDIVLSAQQSNDEKFYRSVIARKAGIIENEIRGLKIIRKSIDARKKDIKINMRFKVYVNEPGTDKDTLPIRYQEVKGKPHIIIIGAGPAGLFAALRLLELGIKPVIIERGKEVSERKIDIALIHREHIINPDSNYCFGEGGAGTFSDGKLYTRSNKRGNIQKILDVFHLHGAEESVLFDSHPHIGTDKLPAIIKNIRKTILDAGGEVHFNERVVDFIIDNGHMKGIITHSDMKYEANAIILASGHSAADIYELLADKKISLEPKPFAMGVRVEHPQELIDSIQYHTPKRGEFLPPATYSLVTQIEGRGVYSFCMCPGGFIVPSSTSPNEIVVNGMSASQRNSPFANSGIVVEVKAEDYKEYLDFGPLAGLKYQKFIENMAFNNGGLKQTAPAQRISDFVSGKISPYLPPNSYIPGVASSPVHFWLPGPVSNRLRKAFIEFDKKMKGFISNDSLLLGVESRTSSPVRVPRNDQTTEHIQIKGLFPAGEGAGYAGGIVSSALDGERCAENATAMYYDSVNA